MPSYGNSAASIGFDSYQDYLRRHTNWYYDYHDDIIAYLEDDFEQVMTFPIHKVRRILFKEGSKENPIFIE